MSEEIVQENGSTIPADSRPLASNLSPAQRQFAEVLGSCLAEHWRRTHTTRQEDAPGSSARIDNANDHTGD